jgi:ribosome-binding factor A
MKTFRTERVSELIKQEVSDLLLRGIKDIRVGAGMVSITRVDVPRDLSQARIFVSIYGTPEVQAQAMAGLTSARGYVRSEIGKRIRMRHTPEVIFEQDISLERGDRIITLLSRLHQDGPLSEKDLPEELSEEVPGEA